MALTTKEKIIDAALSFYDKVRFEKISLSKIAKRAGISKPAIYRHFKSREELEAALMESIAQELVRYVKENNRQDEEFKGQSKTFSLAQPIFDFCKKKRLFYYVISNTSTNFNLDSFFLFIKQRGVKSLSKVFADDGSVTDLEAYKKVVYISGTFLFFQGSRDKNLIDNGIEDSDDMIADYGQKLSDFIITGGLGHELAGVDNERLFALTALCRKSAAASLEDQQKADIFFHSVAHAVSQKGFADVTLDDIAERIGLAKSTLYERFTSKRDLIQSLLIEESVKLFSMMRENMLYAKSPAETVFVMMATEFEFFLRDSDFMHVLRWLQLQNTDGKVVEENAFMANEDVRDFYTFLLNSDIITQKIDLGQPEIGNKALLAWVFYMPVFVMAVAVTHGFSTENYHETLKNLFLYMERGLNYEGELLEGTMQSANADTTGTGNTNNIEETEGNEVEQHSIEQVGKQKETVNA